LIFFLTSAPAEKGLYALRFLDWRIRACLIDFGRLQEADEQLERARELDPLSVRVSFWFAVEAFAKRDFDRAAERLQRTISIDPNNAIAYGFLGTILWHRKMPAQAFNASEKAKTLESIFKSARNGRHAKGL